MSEERRAVTALFGLRKGEMQDEPSDDDVAADGARPLTTKEESGDDDVAVAADAARLEGEIRALRDKLGHAVPLPIEAALKLPAEENLEAGVLENKRSLRDKTRDREWLLEKKRIRDCVSEALELGIVEDPEVVECPLCLEDIPRNERTGYLNASFSFCCGKVFCLQCKEGIDERVKSAIKERRLNEAQIRSTIACCPFCREPIPSSAEKGAQLIAERAKKGCPWSMCNFAQLYELGGQGVEIDLGESAHWYRLSAEQGNVEAQTALGKFYKNGLGGCQKSDLLAERSYSLPAKKQNHFAQCELAILMNDSGRHSESLRWLTLSAVLGHLRSQHMLSLLFFNADSKGIDSSNERALYWGKRASLAGCEKSAWLSGSIAYDISIRYFGKGFSDRSFPSFDCYPQVVTLFRKGKSGGCNYGNQSLEQFEKFILMHCAKCYKPASSLSSKMKRCSRCKVRHYCSKECQQEHWRGGHKRDCCDENGNTYFSPSPD